MDIRREIAALLGQAVVDIAPLGGGCVSAVYEVGLGDGRRLVVPGLLFRFMAWSSSLAPRGFILAVVRRMQERAG